MVTVRRWAARAMLAAICGSCGAAGRAGEAPPEKLAVLCGGYPRAFFFRSAEGTAANRRIDYPRWEGAFCRLMGIEGKVLDEEVPGRSARNVDFFTRFKHAHPEQLVLLHFNGNARDPRWQRGGYFAGHWLYFNGAKVLADVPAERGVSEVRVSDASLFRVNVGRYRTSNEDVGLCELTADGRPDWHRSEQVQLVSVDARRKVIRVQRGCYGTEPRALRAGKAYAAAHASEGPWGRRSHLLWFYNYSTRCPRDAEGRTCADVLASDLARRFNKGGELAAFDGVEFDVLHNEHGGRGRRGLDCDADGKADNGRFERRNTYGIGVVAFLRALRKKLPRKLLLADGHSAGAQRGFGLLNGIESEGWPSLRDAAVEDWSGGLNRHGFWIRNAHPPAFSYINHKYIEPTGQPGRVRRPKVPWSTHRLVFAAGMFTDAAICYSFAPPKRRGELIGVWDELWMGQAKRPGWLGRPLGEAVRLAARSKDLLGGAGVRIDAALLRRLEGRGVRFAPDAGGVKVSAASEEARELRFRLKGVRCEGDDLFVSMTARAAGRSGYPAEMARLAYVGVPADEGLMVRRDLPPAGMCLRGGSESALDAATGAAVRFAAARLGGQRHDAYLVHPPFRGGKTGYTFWSRDVTVPSEGRLVLFCGMGPKSPTRSDGVTFRVLVAEVKAGRAGEFTQCLEHVQKASQWSRHSLSLARWAGRRARLKFVSDCGPKDDATTDHSYWGDVCVVGAGGREAIRRPQRFMTWLNDRPFECGFYFRRLGGGEADLEFAIEGGEAMWITRLTAHAHPDAIYREFANGLVVANPSPRPYTFDLAALLPGRTFRRLKGTALQDPATNNGAPVGAKLNLAPKDALFLVKTGADAR